MSAYRDKPNLCGLCLASLEGESSTTVEYRAREDGEMQNLNANFHNRCWVKLKTKVRSSLIEEDQKAEQENEMRWNKIMDGFFAWVGRLVAMATIVAACWVGHSLISATGEVTYCRIQFDTKTGHFNLYGYVPWRSDVAYGFFKSLEEATATANALGCKVK